jgi:general secretion pathway protein B
MSFILNALRKSEQERQALQSETVTDKILLPQPPQNRSKINKLLVFLLIANMLVITGIVWLVRNDSTPAPNTTTQTLPLPQPEQGAKLESKAIDKSIQPKRQARKAESELASIAELIDKEKSDPALLPVKPGTTKKTTADSVKPPIITGKSEQAIPAIAPAIKVKPDEPEAASVTKGVPFLNDLPFEFRQTVPKFTTNVFVYSQDPEQRFIMVDMVKYKPGQQIKDAMLLKEILPDGFVVDYQSRTFKIRRP